MTMEKGMLLHKGRRNDFPPIPTPEQVDTLLYKVHVEGVKARESGSGNKHYRGWGAITRGGLIESRVGVSDWNEGLKAVAEQ